MCAQRLFAAGPGGAPIRKLHSLRKSDAEAATLALRAFAPEWSIDQHDECDGDMMLMLTPPGPDDVSPTFVLSGSLTGVRLAVTQGDIYKTLGAFETACEAIRRIQQIAADNANAQGMHAA